MKYIFYTLASLLIFAGCSSSKKNYLDRSDTDNALFDAVKALKKNKADTAAINALPTLYNLAQQRHLRKINSLIDLYDKPIIVASDTVLLAYGATPNAAIREMERLGVYAYSSPHNAAHTLENMAERYEYLNNIPRK